MIMGRFRARSILFMSITGLFTVIAVGGGVMALAEGDGYFEGVWYVSTSFPRRGSNAVQFQGLVNL